MRLRYPSREAAFTLAELLVVLLLIGIFTGVMLAEMRGTFQDALLRSGAREITSGLGLAASRAVTFNEPYIFQYDRAGNEFTVVPRQRTRGANDDETLAEKRKVDARLTITIREGVQQELEYDAPLPEPGRTEPDIIQFNPDGTADAREIAVRDTENAEILLRINPVTGRVRIIEEESR